MFPFLPTIILRHRKENLKKCSLRGLESRPDMRFFTYPKDALPSLTGYLLLDLNGPPLTIEAKGAGLLLIDGTWNYASVMRKGVPPMETRSLPAHLRTAYPRKQTQCADPHRGLASVEALYAAYAILGRNTEGLLDSYHWREQFLSFANANVHEATVKILG